MSASEERRKNAFLLARIRRVGRRLNAEIALSGVVGPVWGFVAAFALWRFAVQRWLPGAALVLGVSAAGATWLLVRPRLVTRKKAAVIADRQAGAGGLLLTHLEVGSGEWEPLLHTLVRRLVLPPIRLGRSIGAISLALLFLVVAIRIPLPPRASRPANAAAASRVDELAQKLDAVAKEEPVDPATQAELERLREELQNGNFDAADWEAADSLGKELDRKAEEAGAELSRAEEAAQKLEQALANAESAESVKRAREELEQALMQLSDGKAQNGEQALEQALGNGSDAGAAGRRDPKSEELGDLQRALERRREELAKSYGQDSSPVAGRHEPGRSKRHQKGTGSGDKSKGSGDGEERGEGKGEGKDAQRTLDKNGKHASHALSGKPAHGPAEDTELIFGGRAEMDPERLKMAPMPKGHGGEGDQLWGLVAASPHRNATGQVTPGSGEPVTGEEIPANRESSYLPRNRALIQRYFDSPKRGSP